MDVLEAVASRYSCRAFLPTPVPEKIIRDIIERAARAPSAGNMQPWRVYAIAGRRVEELKALLAPRMATELPKGEGTDYTIYPEPLTEPYRTRRFTVGELLYQSIGVPREDKPSRYRAVFSQLSVLWRASRLIFCPRKSARTCTMGRHWRLSSNCCAAGARVRFAYLSAAGLGFFPPHCACFFEPPRQFDDLFGHGRRLRRCGRPHQFLALPARTARPLCDVRRLRKLAETGF